MSFFEKPILNSPYTVPKRHWELDTGGHPTDKTIESRRRSDLISAMPQSKSRKESQQGALELSAEGLAGQSFEYNVTEFVNEIRREVQVWRALPNPAQWRVTPTTQRLLQHWRAIQADPTQRIRPFFCQLEAVETAIWLAEVAPKDKRRGGRYRARLLAANAEANPDLFRIAMKLATGAGKTTVMAMLIAWQTLNAVRSPNSKAFGTGFLIVTPGITIRDRLRVLLPNDADSYYRTRSLVPSDLLQEMQRAKIVLTNYHAFKLRERTQLAKGTREALTGHGDSVTTFETEGQMVQRVMPDLMGSGPITVINDEAHHCYRERQENADAGKLTGDARKEAEENREAARLWISGIEAAKRKLKVRTVYDLSATPFFLSGSGWVEGTLFPWVVSDFSLMDAIECGIVKLPRVPVADNVPGQPEPLYRNLWKAIGKKMPKKTRGARPDPDKLPLELKTAIDALYGHYEQTYKLWEAEKVGIPPVFIIVCNNTTNSELLRDYVAGWERENEDGLIETVKAKCELFSNFSSDDDRLPRPRTVLIDSATLEAGGDVDKTFRDAHAEEIEAFRREQAERGQGAEQLTDADILREVMNTVGRKGKLGEQVRCVVSVSMLTEGWDANNVTHILGLRAFGTQLICEQVIGRALRRLSYDLDDQPDPVTGEHLFRTEYADIMGIDGLNFSDGPRVSPPQPPRDVISVRAVSPERDHLEITFPRVQGYVADLPPDRLDADFSGLEPYVLTPEKVGAAEVTMQGIVGEGVLLTLDYLNAQRRSTIATHIAKHMIFEKLRDANERPKMHLFPAAKRLANQWLAEGHLVCKGGTMEAQLLYRQLADEVCDLILGALIDKPRGDSVLRAVLDPYTPTGSTMDVSFTTSKATRYPPRPDRSHVNWIITDSQWEAELAAVIEGNFRVLSYTKNHNLGFEVPYLKEGEPHMYRPDFLLRLDTPEPTTLVVEVKGFRDHDAMLKAETMRHKWVPGVNRLGRFGRWGFAELRDPFIFGPELDSAIDVLLGKVPA
ncbi:DEAD/DEAH box helicase family protein [Tropicimonas sp. TH_r6]|uniref:BPTD_3080 family restriction endonuclease n=1 Tax=Tropicimonas sp. TH_r6 TaxID=3082085 RepID=UPI002952AE65|nr:DEAD/DEAH box helicase family protein [Tropicimonas sp. TH_r6]MDV7145643.1 DEAD/DEAH box helicase family protein [Tropicimonas sp. TH_r6]